MVQNPVDQVLLLSSPESGVIVNAKGIILTQVLNGMASVNNLPDGIYFYRDENRNTLRFVVTRW